MKRVSLLSKQPCTESVLPPQLAADLLPVSGVPYWNLYPCRTLVGNYISPRETAAVKAFKYYLPHYAPPAAPLKISIWQHDATEIPVTPCLNFCSVYDVRHKTMPVILFLNKSPGAALLARQNRVRTNSEYLFSASWFFSIKEIVYYYPIGLIAPFA